MKFFKCHSQKFKNDKVVKLQDKFTDIGPDVFADFQAKYIVLSEKTQTLRDYAFSGLCSCGIYIPASVTEIEPLAFEGMSPDAVVYCRSGSQIAIVCAERDITVCFDVQTFFEQADKAYQEEQAAYEVEMERARAAAEEAARIAAEKAAAEEAARIAAEKKAAEEAARIAAEKKAAEEAARIAAEKKAAEEAARIEAEKKAAEEAARIAAEKKAAQTAQQQKPAAPVSSSLFRNIDEYDYELQKMNERIPASLRTPSRITPTPKPVEPVEKKKYQTHVMRNLDEFDEELERMKKKGIY